MSHGSVVYSGPTERCLPHFAALGYEPEQQTNPLDFLIDVSSIDTRDADAEEESRKRLGTLVQAWQRNSSSDNEKPAPAITASRHNDNVDGDTPANRSGDLVQKTMSGKRPGVLAQTIILLPRSLKNMIRGYPELVGHVLQGVVLGVLMGITFFDLHGTPSDIQSLKTLSFQVVPVFCYMTQGMSPTYMMTPLTDKPSSRLDIQVVHHTRRL
jgi:hypothetical protein